MKLHNAFIAALERGAIFIFIDDLIFVRQIYPFDKSTHDYIFYTLAKYPNFYWYILPFDGTADTIEEHLHCKILTFYYISPRRPTKYLVSQHGSFNPSYPLSLTLEMGIFCQGTFSNPVAQMMADYIYALTRLVYSSTEQNENMPGGHDERARGLNAIGAYATDKQYHQGVSSDVLFCGIVFCPETRAEERISFAEKDVHFNLGCSPSEWYPNFSFGLDLVRGVFEGAQKYCKVGIMNSFVEEYPYCKETGSPACPENQPGRSQWGPWLIQDQVLDLLKGGKELYVMQKWFGKSSMDTPPGVQGLGGLWNYLQKNLPRVLSNNQFSIRYTSAAIHWKYYMSDNQLLFSTQHPTPLFYYYKPGEEVTMGYDLLVGNCPKLIAYFDNLFQFYWSNFTSIPHWDSQSVERLPCSGLTDQTTGCCAIEGTNCASLCYPGGKGPGRDYAVRNGRCISVGSEQGTYFSLAECQSHLPPTPVPPAPKAQGLDAQAAKRNSEYGARLARNLALLFLAVYLVLIITPVILKKK